MTPSRRYEHRVSRNEARRALAWLAEHVRDEPDFSDEAVKYRGGHGWAAGSSDDDLRAVAEYFDVLRRIDADEEAERGDR